MVVERASEARVDVGADGVAAIAGAGRVITELRAERSSAGEVGDGRESPTGNDVADEVVSVG